MNYFSPLSILTAYPQKMYLLLLLSVYKHFYFLKTWKLVFLYFKEYILNYFDEGCRFSNAATEGINNEIERINRAGNGCKFKHLRAKALYAPLLISRTNYSIKLSTIKKWIPNFDCTYTFTSSQKGTYKIITKYFYTEETKPFVVQPVKIYEIENMTDIIYAPEDKAFIPKVNELSIIGAMIRANAE